VACFTTDPLALPGDNLRQVRRGAPGRQSSRQISRISGRHAVLRQVDHNVGAVRHILVSAGHERVAHDLTLLELDRVTRTARRAVQHLQRKLTGAVQERPLNEGKARTWKGRCSPSDSNGLRVGKSHSSLLSSSPDDELTTSYS